MDVGTWDELTVDQRPAVRITASDLAQARRISSGIRSDNDRVSVILDVTVAVAGDFRSARRGLEVAGADAAVGYVGTTDGLVGLLADIESAGVADGVTLLSAVVGQDLHALGSDVLRRLELRNQTRRAS